MLRPGLLRAVGASRLQRRASALATLDGPATWVEVDEVEPRSACGGVVLKLGLTHTACDALGDVTAISWAERMPGKEPAGAVLASLHYSALSRSDSDELYHATWGHVSGRYSLRLPFAAEVIATNAQLQPRSLDEGTREGCGAWLARLRASQEDWEEWLRKAAPPKAVTSALATARSSS